MLVVVIFIITLQVAVTDHFWVVLYYNHLKTLNDIQMWY